MGRRETPLDPAAGPVQRFAYELRKLRQEADGLTYREMARRAHYSVTTLSQAAAGEQLPSLAVTLAYVKACGGAPEEWERRWHEASEESATTLGNDEAADAPYQGLSRYEPADHDRFFGRDDLVDALRALTASHRFTAVFGPSGSGKSSLLRAGLIPTLQKSGQTSQSGQSSQSGPTGPAALRILTPGEHPLRTHEDALKPKEDGGPGDTVLVVDQFEEVFTLCRDQAERTQFIDRLLAARTDPGSRLRVVIAVRADFYGRCAEHRALADALSEASLLVGPMTRAELREAVIRPAQSAGLIVERDLTAHLVDEVDGEPGGLPLLSHALRETWLRRRGRALTMAAYEAAGGVRGAIAKTAEDVYATLSPEQAALARQLLLRLITPGEGSQDTRRPVDRTELDFAPAGEVALVLERLTRARLLTLDDDTVDLAHEALITSWPRLRTWIEETRERLRTHRRLTEAARAWDDLGRDPGALYRGTRLATADEHLADQPLTPLEEAFLTASRTTRTTELRRRRGLFTALATLLVLALIAGVTAWQQSRTSDRRHREAEARRIAAVADSMRATDPVAAARLSVAAWKLAHTVETRSALLSALNHHEQDSFTVPERGTDTAVRRLTADGRTLVSASRDHVRVWDLRTHRRTHSHPGPGKRLTGPLNDVISPDGRTIALSGTKGVALWDIRTGRLTGRLDGMEMPTVRFSRDGRVLLADDGGALRVWDVRSRRLLLRVPLGEATTWDAVLSDDGRRLALCADRYPLRIWDVARRGTLRLPWAAELGRDSCDQVQLAFSPDGTDIALASPTDITVRDITTGEELAGMEARTPGEVRFSPEGEFLIAIDETGEFLLWRLASPGATPVWRHSLANETAHHHEVDFAAGEIHYLNGSGTAVRSLRLGPAITSRWRSQAVDDALLSPDGRTLATLRVGTDKGDERSVRLQDTRTGRTVLTMPRKPCSDDDATDEAVDDSAPGDATGAVEPPRVTGPGNADVVQVTMDCSNLMAFSADGRFFAYAPSHTLSTDPSGQRITVWDLATRREHATLAVRPGANTVTGVVGLALSDDGRTLFVSREANRQVVEVWDLRRERRARTLNGISAAVMAVRDDQRTLVASPNRVADLRTGRSGYRALGDNEPAVLAFSPDGTYFAAGDRLGHVTVWDGDVRNRIGVLGGTGSDEIITALAFSPDGRTLAVAGDEGTVQLWDVASSRPLGSALPTPGDSPLTLAFDRDGTTLYVAGEHVPLRTYDVAPAHVVRQVCERAGSGLSRADWTTYLPDLPYERTC
ncbi:helix-turn-helix domain-containing protein [Streptomyces phyllanthi]|uniref:DNA-binding protein n=1 Tax=Streptomyces phyllanthi TaxID=1803180 RepID=A0A5N8WF37_9ACTN|nr:helix-turn-helix domain-containing protein [Streptomyces phyllanthi]MPY46101.1 DNA-binding protein [Streptomyces phyllanthi]